MDLEGTIEKVQESSCVLVRAKNLPGGPRRYCRKSRKVHLYWCRPATFQVEGTIEKVQESSPVLMQDM